MTKRIKIIATIAMLSSLATSCIMYHPQAVDIPLMQHKGDTRIDANFSMTSLFQPAFNVTGTYAFSDWGAGQLHVNWNGNKNVYLQGAFGTYNASWGKYVLEGYAGYGFGYSSYEPLSNDDDNSSNSNKDNSSTDLSITSLYEGTYQKAFLQFNTGWAGLLNGCFDIGVGLQGAYFIPNFSQTMTDGKKTTFDTPTPMIEPQFLMSIGSPNLKVSLKIGFCAFLGEADFGYEPLNVGLGLNYRF